MTKERWGAPYAKRKRCEDQRRRVGRFLVRARQVTQIAIPWVTIALLVIGTVSPEHAGRLMEIQETGPVL